MEEQQKRGFWTDAEIADILARYFGEKLSPPELKRMVSELAAGRTDLDGLLETILGQRLPRRESHHKTTGGADGENGDEAMGP